MAKITHKETLIKIGNKVFEFSAIPADYQLSDNDGYTLPPSVAEDIDVLLAEVMRLQTENDVLRKILIEK